MYFYIFCKYRNKIANKKRLNVKKHKALIFKYYYVAR